MRSLPLLLALLLAFVSGELRAESPETKEGLRLALNRLWVQKREGGFYFMELFRFEGKLPSGGGLHFSLPPDARLLDDPHGRGRHNFIPEPGGLLLKEEVPAKGKMVALAYGVASSTERFLWERRFLYPTDLFEIWVEKAGLRFKAPGMELLGETEFGGKAYLRYAYPRAEAGARIALELSPPGLALDFKPFYYALVALFLLGGPVWASVRRRRDLGKREELLRAIALLDDQFAEGSLSASEHLKLREDKIRRLKAISGLTGKRDRAQG